jgi:hypothetical protein
LFNTLLINKTNQVVNARANYKLVPDYQINIHPTIDLLIIVGGDYTNEVLKIKVTHRIKAQDNTLTSKGISARIGMSLYLLSWLTSKELAIVKAKTMEFTWVGE